MTTKKMRRRCEDENVRDLADEPESMATTGAADEECSERARLIKYERHRFMGYETQNLIPVPTYIHSWARA